MAEVIFDAGAGTGDLSTNGNYRDGAAPSASDILHLKDTSTAITGGLDLSGTQLAEVWVWKSQTGDIGTPEAPLQLNTAILHFCADDAAGRAKGPGFAYVSIEEGAAATVFIHGTGNARSRPSYPSLIMKTDGFAHVIYVEDGADVGLCWNINDTAQFTTLEVSGPSSRVEIGEGCTGTTIDNRGHLVTRSAATTIHNRAGGRIRTEGVGAITTINDMGSGVYNSSGTITTLNIKERGYSDFGSSTINRTVTNLSMDLGARLRRGTGLTISNAITFNEPCVVTTSEA